ncbi:hypothetical protein BDV24DRAFT_156639 [Aspergillus arachidicola]|uniref:Altered inheritance of mitochondria protein 9, mitochondrial n=1 Tax=Aspergillus arachidicola TaxID=656916 RepID=A0A5N6XT62_9EURO|nr:hypothetical protein BDV24DRAFT_156639 [Aspergillus arachidicola]
MPMLPRMLKRNRSILPILSRGTFLMAKIGEGLYNKSFKLTMGNGKTVIARIPNLNAGPAFLTIALKLITILYLPVPKVLVWNPVVDSINCKNLVDVWIDMDLERKVQMMEDISRYGCLFYRKDAPPGSHPAIVEGDNLSYELKYNIAEMFSIGPMVDTVFWSKGRGDMDVYRGLSWIQKHAIPRSLNDLLFVSYSQNDPAEHISLLQRYLSVAPHLIPQEQDILGSFLWHPDLRTPNIFVDDDSGHITIIIDWQSARAGPLFPEGRYPDFLDYSGDLMLELPENFKQLDENTQSAVKDKVTNSILLYLYENYTVERNPILSKVFRYPNGKTITDPIRFIGNTWNRDILPLQESLIRIQNRTVKYPIDFSSKEIHQHYKNSKDWNKVQDFWDALSGILSKDSWTSHTTYDQALSIYSQIHL